MLKKINKKIKFTLHNSSGFTLIEIIVVIAIIAILAAIVIVAINPAKRFQDARQTQRQANVETILNAVQQNMVDNKGLFTCSGTPGFVLDDTVRTIKYVNTSTDGETNLAPCLSSYLAILPVDPEVGEWVDIDDYDTGYTIQQLSTGQITITAPEALNDVNPEPGYSISVTR